ncbi:hypothetical protein ACOZ38_25635 [Sphaerisporangium viridialbum]|uniref:hypothetical protein n=1 Tax=Sphaerisporangium viridialbum TaxID=46189 RepID=UPI003C79029C
MTAATTIPAPYNVARDAWESSATLTDTLHAIAYSSAASLMHAEHGGDWDEAHATETETVMSEAAYRIEAVWGHAYDTSDGFTYEELAPAHQAQLLEDLISYLGEYDGEFPTHAIKFPTR